MSATVDRNVLVGLLALDDGLIDQRALVQALRAWSHASDRALADILVEQGAIGTHDRGRIEALTVQHLERAGGADSLTVLASGLPPMHSSTADPDVTRPYEKAADEDRGAWSAGAPDREADEQRFHILRPHAQGGLG